MHHSQNKIVITSTEAEHLDVVWDMTKAKNWLYQDKESLLL